MGVQTCPIIPFPFEECLGLVRDYMPLNITLVFSKVRLVTPNIGTHYEKKEDSGLQPPTSTSRLSSLQSLIMGEKAGVRTWAQVANAPAQTDHIQIIHFGDDPADPESYDVTVPLRLNMTIDIV